MGKGNNSRKKEVKKAKEGKAEGPGHPQNDLVPAGRLERFRTENCRGI